MKNKNKKHELKERKKHIYRTNKYLSLKYIYF